MRFRPSCWRWRRRYWATGRMQSFTRGFTARQPKILPQTFTLDGAMTAQTQTAHILALRFGLTPQKWKQKTIQRLLELLEQQNGHLVTGFLGTPYFCAALSQNGCWQQAYDLMLKKRLPRLAVSGAAGGHHCVGTLGWPPPGRHDVVRGDELFQPLRIRRGGGMAVRRVCRYWPAAGHGRFCAARLAPRPGGGLRWAQAWHQTPFGRYALQWQVDDRKITVTAAIPPNAAAKSAWNPVPSCWKRTA